MSEHEITKDIVQRLFNRFAAIWPMWASQTQHVPLPDLVEEWQLGLRGLSVEQISHGLDVVRKREKWPTSIATFREAARDGMCASQRAFEARLRRERDRRCREPATRERGRAELRHIRQLLGVAGKSTQQAGSS